MMFLISVNEWIGPNTDLPREDRFKSVPQNRATAFVTRLPLEEGLKRLAEYEDWFNKRWYPHTALNISVLSVSLISDIPDGLCSDLHWSIIEQLEITPIPVLRKVKPGE